MVGVTPPELAKFFDGRTTNTEPLVLGMARGRIFHIPKRLRRSVGVARRARSYTS